ncbi:MAG TPA: hypothetical protein VGV38_21310, partial [Pyrinomonadaceae bacterium]|nr:hypothetical protein [Pyrinomonadaceae bacterium]
IYTTPEDSFYLKGRSTDYPTALLDFDGNERATIHLRNSSLNLLHLLLTELRRRDLSPDVRRAATEAFFRVLESRRPAWQKTSAEMREELGALRRLIEKQRALVEAQPKKFTKEERDAGRDQDKTRHFARLDSWLADERKYTEYLRTLDNLLALRRETFDPSKLRDEDLIARGAMGDANTVYDLQNYVVGPAPAGLAPAPDGSLDFQKSFARVDYFDLLARTSVRNNVQPGVSNRPVDFVALRLPVEQLDGLRPDEENASEVIWLHGGRDSQALLFASRESGQRPLLLRYQPVARLAQNAGGRISFERVEWREGLPLKIWEDANLALPEGSTRGAWLGEWHSDLEWLRALHRTVYSNGLVGLHEQLARHTVPAIDPSEPGISDDERLLRRLRRRQRALVETDMLVHANDQWNFDVRGFNPGGNHGSFFRVSTHSTLMFAGGERTNVPRGLAVEEPYDSLSFAPTVLALTGQLEAGQRPVPVLWRQGFRTFPGRVIKELFDAAPGEARPLADGEAARKNR